jgi:hypothetical protein
VVKINKEFLYLKLLTNFYTINVRLHIENRKTAKRFNRKERKVFLKMRVKKQSSQSFINKTLRTLLKTLRALRLKNSAP